MSRRAASLVLVALLLLRPRDCDSITLGAGELSDPWQIWDVGEPAEFWDSRRPGDTGDQQVRVLHRSEVDEVLQWHPAVFLLFSESLNLISRYLFFVLFRYSSNDWFTFLTPQHIPLNDHKEPGIIGHHFIVITCPKYN